jgi:hypothetical protein
MGHIHKKFDDGEPGFHLFQILFLHCIEKQGRQVSTLSSFNFFRTCTSLDQQAIGHSLHLQTKTPNQTIPRTTTNLQSLRNSTEDREVPAGPSYMKSQGTRPGNKKDK